MHISKKKKNRRNVAHILAISESPSHVSNRTINSLTLAYNPTGPLEGSRLKNVGKRNNGVASI
jgi:hypothetical protein